MSEPSHDATPGVGAMPEILRTEGQGIRLEDLTPEERELHWRKHIYQGDKPQLTLRAIAMGAVLGMLMSASNLYTVLKVGWAFGVAVTACVMSYVIWNLLRAFSGGRVGKMGILENACMASTASAAGYSTGSTLATMFGAMLILESEKTGENLKTWTSQPLWIVASFTLCTAALGVFLAVPTKRQMINQENLPFPTGIASAETLKSLYSEGKEAVQKAYVLIVGLLAGVVIGIMNTGEGTLHLIDRVLGKVRLPELVPAQGFARVTPQGHLTTAAAAPSQNLMLPAFGFEPSGLLIGAGMIVGLRVSLSMLLGSLLLYFWVGPWLISLDTINQGAEGYVPSVKAVGNGAYYQIVHWALWAGTSVMVFSSLTAVAMQWRTIGRAFTKAFSRSGAAPTANESLEVPVKWLIIGLIPISLALIAVQYLAFHISPVLGLIAVVMAFLLSMVASRATGETDTTPIGAMGKVMQLLFAVLSPGNVTHNLASAGVAANSASSSADLLTDLKMGYLVGANPRKQFLAQFTGVFFGTMAIVPAWYLMVPDKAAIDKYPLPATQQWVAVARLLTEGVENLPITSRYAILLGAFVGVGLPILDRLVPKPLKKYMPSAMGLGLSWIMPFCNTFSFAIGATIAWIWAKLSKRSASKFNIPVASGLIAGEGMIKAIIAMTATALGLLGLQ